MAELARGPGLDAVKMIHLNDSRLPCNSRRDRHWHLGQGAIGLTGLRHLLSHPWLKAEAAILETQRRLIQLLENSGLDEGWRNLLAAFEAALRLSAEPPRCRIRWGG